MHLYRHTMQLLPQQLYAIEFFTSLLMTYFLETELSQQTDVLLALLSVHVQLCLKKTENRVHI